jgi:hypothetical protein
VFCVSKSEVSRVCREAKKGKQEGTKKVFLSLRKHTNIPKRATNLDDFQKDVLLRTVFECFAKGEFPIIKNVTLTVRGKQNCVQRLCSYFIHSFIVTK